MSGRALGGAFPLRALVTRPRHQAGRLAARLRARGIGCLVEPMLEIEARAWDPAVLEAVVDVICWMAKAFAANVLATGAANRALHGLRAVPVEDRTPALVASLLHAHLGSASPWSRGATVCGAKTGDARLLLRALRVLRRRETNGTLQVQLCSVHQSELIEVDRAGGAVVPRVVV